MAEELWWGKPPTHKGEKEVLAYFQKLGIGKHRQRDRIARELDMPRDSVSSYASVLCRTGWLLGHKQEEHHLPGWYSLNRPPTEDKLNVVRRDNSAEDTVSTVLSDITLMAIQAEATRAHLLHQSNSMLNPDIEGGDDRRLAILAEEFGEVARELNDARVEHRPTDLGKLVEELVQTAAMAASWAEVLDGWVKVLDGQS